jgi:uncharacterized membrane protein YraQ (UPF0718 family)
MALLIFGTFYAAMVAAGYVIEIVVNGLGLTPSRNAARIAPEGISWNYTTWLNIVFLLLAVVLMIRFVRSGGWPMLRMMGGSPDDSHDHAEHGQQGNDDTGHQHNSHASHH